MKKKFEVQSVGEALLRLLRERGIEYLFANAGTDFAPIIEAYAQLGADREKVPEPITVPHENVAVAAAMGYYLLSGKMQAVMVHVNVGSANALCCMFNAMRGNVPLLFMSGRTPWTEFGPKGTRDVYVHWPQEMFDQGGMMREAVKWDYELRHPAQLEPVLDRALRIANSEPKGPAYLNLPREVLCEEINSFEFFPQSRQAVAVPPAAAANAIEQLAGLVAKASNPLVLTSALGQNPAAVPALERVADQFALPVIQHAPRSMSISSLHPMHLGYDPGLLIGAADLILCIDSATPWLPRLARPADDATVVHINADPLFRQLPVHGFPSDLAITTTAETGLKLLAEALAGYERDCEAGIAARRLRLAEIRAQDLARHESLLAGATEEDTITTAWLTRCISDAKPDDAVVIREAPIMNVPLMKLTEPRTFFGAGAAGGLGWGLGCAIGARMADPERLVIACVGDGAYMFAVPVSAHYMAMEQDVPFLTVIYNNRRWGEVNRATRSVYPDGVAAKDVEHEVLTNFDERLELHKVVESCGGYGERVSDPNALPGALARALRMVREEGRQVVLDVICKQV